MIMLAISTFVYTLVQIFVFIVKSKIKKISNSTNTVHTTNEVKTTDNIV